MRSPAVLVLSFLVGPTYPLLAEEASIRLGDITIRYDKDRWEVVDILPATMPVLPDTGPLTRHFVCIAPDCFDRPSVWVTAQPITEATEGCSAFEDNRRRVVPTLEKDFGGLPLSMFTTHSYCRARSPVHRQACGANGDYAYAFGTGVHFGCGGIQGVPAEMFQELLEGISLADGPVRKTPAKR